MRVIEALQDEADGCFGWMAPLTAADLPALGAWISDRLDGRHNLQLIS